MAKLVCIREGKIPENSTFVPTPKYKFSKAMKKAGAGGLVWNEETLAKYLVKPRAFVKGTKMVFAGIKKTKDMENLIAFLKKASK